MTLTFKGRPVSAEVDHSGAACDAYIAQAQYEDGLFEDLTDDELDALNEYAGTEIAEYCLEADGYWKE
jgi:hypothetical protein